MDSENADDWTSSQASKVYRWGLVVCQWVFLHITNFTTPNIFVDRLPLSYFIRKSIPVIFKKLKSFELRNISFRCSKKISRAKCLLDPFLPWGSFTRFSSAVEYKISNWFQFIKSSKTFKKKFRRIVSEIFPIDGKMIFFYWWEILF